MHKYSREMTGVSIAYCLNCLATNQTLFDSLFSQLFNNSTAQPQPDVYKRQVFHLTDEQQQYAQEYAANLDLFLDDQFAAEMCIRDRKHTGRLQSPLRRWKAAPDTSRFVRCQSR